MNKILKISILILVFPLILNASGGGSIYSRYGVGELIHNHGARSLGLGALGIASPNRTSINLINPAANYKLDLTRFEAGFSFESMNVDDLKLSSVYNNSSFSGFSVGIPLQKDWGMTMSFGVTPFSNVGYEVINSNDEEYTERFIGDGGISKLFLGGSYKLPFDVVFGASMDYYTGSISNQSVIEFEDSDKLDGGFEKKRKYQGAGFTLGMISPDFSKYLGVEKLSELHLGLSYSYISDLKTSNIILTGKFGEFEEVFSEEVESKIPDQLGIGLNFTWNKDYLVLFDYIYSSWKDYQLGEETFKQLKNLSRLGIGFEYKNSDINQYSSLTEQMAFRGGFSYEKSQFIFGDSEINQLGIHAGFSFPTGYGSNLEFGFMYGKRGTTDNGLLKENFIKADITISFGELWFIRQDR